MDELRKRLATKGAQLRLCGWRRLRQLLAQGENVFWRRDNTGRVWLCSAAKVAQHLQVERLIGQAVELPVAAVLGSIGDYRAHLYASFHSGRKHDNPISRQSLHDITHVPTRTQREYDRRLDVQRETCIAVGERATPTTIQRRAVAHGRNTFILKDKLGKLGQAGAEYVAWQLPNRYGRIHRTCATNRQRRINRQLKHTDLADLRAQGNGVKMCRRYFAEGRIRPNPTQPIYYHDPTTGVWCQLGGVS